MKWPKFFAFLSLLLLLSGCSKKILPEKLSIEEMRQYDIKTFMQESSWPQTTKNTYVLNTKKRKTKLEAYEYLKNFCSQHKLKWLQGYELLAERSSAYENELSSIRDVKTLTFDRHINLSTEEKNLALNSIEMLSPNNYACVYQNRLIYSFRTTQNYTYVKIQENPLTHLTQAVKAISDKKIAAREAFFQKLKVEFLYNYTAITKTALKNSKTLNFEYADFSAVNNKYYFIPNIQYINKNDSLYSIRLAPNISILEYPERFKREASQQNYSLLTHSFKLFDRFRTQEFKNETRQISNALNAQENEIRFVYNKPIQATDFEIFLEVDKLYSQKIQKRCTPPSFTSMFEQNKDILLEYTGLYCNQNTLLKTNISKIIIFNKANSEVIYIAQKES